MKHLKLAIVPDAAIVVDRHHYKLELWEKKSMEGPEEVVEHLALTRVYPIAVGMPGHRTDSGLHQIEAKKKNSGWTAPMNVDWLPEEMWGQHIDDSDPRCPIVSRWMLFNEDESEGIHGTNSPDSLGSAASHGCVRMSVPDVEELYPKVPIGTLVFIN